MATKFILVVFFYSLYPIIYVNGRMNNTFEINDNIKIIICIVFVDTPWILKTSTLAVYADELRSYTMKG